MARRSRPRRATPGFRWQGNKLVPLSTTKWNEETQDWDINPDESGLADDEIPKHDPPPIKKDDDHSLITGSGDSDQGSEINTSLGKNELGQDMMQTDRYGISGDDSTKTTTFSTHFEGVDYAGLSEYELSKFTSPGSDASRQGWIYKTHQRGEGEVGYTGNLVRDKIRIKVNKYGTPWQDPNAGKYPTGTGADDEDPDANVLTADDEGRFPDEPGYGKGPDWTPDFQTSGGETDMPTDSEIDFMMDDANYGIGGELNTTNTDTGANIETFDLGQGYGNEGGWTPTPKDRTGSKGKRSFGGGVNKAASGSLRRQVRKLSPSLISGPR